MYDMWFSGLKNDFIILFVTYEVLMLIVQNNNKRRLYDLNVCINAA